MFVGSFLDNFPGGTSIILLLNILGSTFSMVVYIFNMYAYEWSKLSFNKSKFQKIDLINPEGPYYLLIASLSISLTGGMTSLLTSAYRYITLNTNESNRSIKFLTLEIVYIIGKHLDYFIPYQIYIFYIHFVQ